MPKVVNGGVTMEVPASEVPFYIRAGFKKVEEPVEKPAQKESIEPVEPEAVLEDVVLAEPVPTEPKLSAKERKALEKAGK